MASDTMRGAAGGAEGLKGVEVKVKLSCRVFVGRPLDRMEVGAWPKDSPPVTVRLMVFGLTSIMKIFQKAN